MDAVVLLVVVVLVVAIGFVLLYRWPAVPLTPAAKTTDVDVTYTYGYPRSVYTYPSTYYYNSYPYVYTNPYRRYSTGLLY